ncbi:hypothetical protein FSP39_007782 [Pinctada imbricata]|uniref:Reverse transcriptase domain-containing protein n=1 Tax=Pinctada imbricata TaxID=66713 RepID=A0AA88XGI3_PINIB|nr:hypothetical protein FSP39_007782 [Pinctada imbricata]
MLINNKYTFLLINIYGPNNDNPDFYRKIRDLINNANTDFVILAGDFNLVIDPEKDYYNYKHINNPNARKVVLDLMEEFNLTDVWRVHNKESKGFTWSVRNPYKRARLDFFLVSDELMNIVESSQISPGYRTDHSLIEICLKFENQEKGRGFWRFNNSLLRDKKYIDKVKQEIEKTKRQYSLESEESNIEDNNETEESFSIDNKLFLDTLLMNIRGVTISYSSYLKKSKTDREKVLEAEINRIEKLINTNVELQNSLAELKEELENYRKEKMKGVMVRTRARWIEEGEKPSKYFCSMERRNYVNKTLTKLLDDNDRVITHQTEILDTIKSFYKDLYSSRDEILNDIDLNSTFSDSNIPKLNENQKLTLEGDLTMKEAGEVLRNMKNNKTPGPDGFTAEFFKFFWKDLGHFLLRAWNSAFETNELAISQRQGIITILPKGNKSRERLKNWRPISLLNVSYKILSGILAKRTKSVLPHLIHSDQKGFMAGRFIGDNTRTIYDILQLTKEKQIAGMLLLVDFEKAFDSISWKFMYNCLTFFGFGENYLKWIKILYKDTRLCVIQNGFFSEFFEIGRGCRQGDPISPYLFNICVEILGILIRENRSLKGIFLGSKEYRLLQYADDTCLFLDGSEKSLKSALDLLFQFSKFSGLKPNIEKTQVIWIGKKMGCKQRLCNNYQLNWNNTTFTALGITFSADVYNIENINFENKFCIIRSEITQWSKRNLTTLGKITVVKSLLLPKLTHLFFTLPCPKHSLLKEINDALFRYIWNNKRDKVSRKQMVKDYNEGGCRMIDIFAYAKAIKGSRRKSDTDPVDFKTNSDTGSPSSESRELMESMDINHTEDDVSDHSSLQRKPIRAMDEGITIQDDIMSHEMMGSLQIDLSGLQDECRPQDKREKRKKRRSLRFVGDITQQPEDVFGSAWLDASPESTQPLKKNRRRLSKKITIPPCSKITNIEEDSIELARSPEKESAKLQVTSVTPEVVLTIGNDDSKSVSIQNTTSTSFDLPSEVMHELPYSTPKCARFDNGCDKSTPYTPSQPIDGLNLSSTPDDPLSDSVYMTPMSEVKQKVTAKTTEKNVTTSTSKYTSRQFNRSSRKMTSGKKSQQQNEEISKQQTSGFMSICKSLAGKFMNFKKSSTDNCSNHSCHKADELQKEEETETLSKSENCEDVIKTDCETGDKCEKHSNEIKDLVDDSYDVNTGSENLVSSLSQNTPQKSREHDVNEVISPNSNSTQNMGSPPENTIVVKVEVHNHVGELHNVESQREKISDAEREMAISIVKPYIKYQPSQLDKELDKIIKIDEFGKEIPEGAKKKGRQPKGSLVRKTLPRRLTAPRKVRKGSSSDRKDEESAVVSPGGNADDFNASKESGREDRTSVTCKPNCTKLTESNIEYKTELVGVVSNLEVKKELDIEGVDEVDGGSIGCMKAVDTKTGKDERMEEDSTEQGCDSCDLMKSNDTSDANSSFNKNGYTGILKDLVKEEPMISEGNTSVCAEEGSEKSTKLVSEHCEESATFHQENFVVDGNIPNCEDSDIKSALLSSSVSKVCEEKLHYEPCMTDCNNENEELSFKTADKLPSNNDLEPKKSVADIFADLDCGDVTNESVDSQLKMRYKKRRRRSLDVALAIESKELLADMPDIDCENSEISVQGRRSRRIRRKSLELCKGALRHNIQERHSSLSAVSSVDNEESIESSSPANEVTTPENEDDTSNTVLSEIDLCLNVGPKLKTYGKRKRTESSQDIENLYLNKNYQAPAEKKWETIFESPNINKSNLLGKRKMKRSLEFDINLVYHVPPLKQKKRVQKAMKNGWNPKRKKYQTLADDFVVEKISEMDKLLAE